MRISVFIAALTLFTQAHAEVGVIDPAAFGARFNTETQSRSFFRIEDPDQGWGTAFVIDAEEGLVMTAAHVVIAHMDGTYTLTQAGGLTLHAVPIWKSASFDQSVFFVGDVTHTMIQTRIWQQTRRGQYPLYEDLSADYMKQRDAAVLKITAEDLAAFKAANIPAVKVRTTPLEKGERLFLAGYAPAHYHPAFLAFLNQALPNRAPLRNTDGTLTYKTGKFFEVRSEVLLTRASEQQEQDQGNFLESDAIDSYQGDSGAPLMDQDGAIVAIHNASDSSLSNPRENMVRRSLVTLATAIQGALLEFRASAGK